MAQRRLHSILFLTVPVLLILSAEFYATRRDVRLKRDEGPFRVEVLSIRRESILPDEAYLGYDTKVTAIFGSRGNPPGSEIILTTGRLGEGHAQLIVGKGKSSKKISATQEDGPAFASETRIEGPTGVQTYFFINSKAFPTNQPLQLVGRLTVRQDYSIPVQGSKKDHLFTAETPFQFTVRKQEEKLTFPPISKARPFELASTDVIQSNNTTFPGYYVRLKFKALKELNSFPLTPTYCTDAKGRKYKVCRKCLRGSSFRENGVRRYEHLHLSFPVSAPGPTRPSTT